MNASAASKELRRYASKEKAKNLSRFYKTGKGNYGEGDAFLGITVPDIRNVVQRFRNIPLAETKKLIRSPWHEERLCGLLILVDQFERDRNQKRIYDTYLTSTRWINSWDLVDLTAPKIVGQYLEERPRDVLYALANSEDVWERRISILATAWFIAKDDFHDTLKISHMLRNDTHDLIHKAVGWMLREVGKRDRKKLESFLRYRYRRMPRTMLRYAIEKFPEKLRQAYLAGTI